MKIFLVLIFALASVFVAEAKLNIIAATADLGALAAEIGGDKIELTTIARPGEDPHFIEAKPSFYVKFNRADVLIEGGAELEIGWLPPLLEGARNSKIQAGKPGRILCNEGISLLEIPTSLDRSKGDIHAAGNPHYTTDPANAKIIAEHICSALSQLDAKSADAFRANLKTFDATLELKMAEWKKILAPYAGQQVVTYHNYWPYFAKQFGLKMELFLEPKPGIPPSPSHLAGLITKMKEENIHTIIIGPNLNRKTAETVANHTGAELVNVPAYPNDKSGAYIAWMDDFVKSLAKALAAKSK